MGGEVKPVERSQSEKDQELWTAFNALANHKYEGRLTQIKLLIEEGATTAAFTDYELGRFNFAMAVERFLEARYRSEPKRERDVLRSLHLLLPLGDAPWTNRAYVGNGGAPAFWWIFEFFSRLRRNPRHSYEDSQLTETLRDIQSLLQALTKPLAPNHPAWSSFLDGFCYRFIPSLSVRTFLTQEQRNLFQQIAALCFDCLFDKSGAAFAFNDWLGDSERPMDPAHPLVYALTALFREQRRDELLEILTRIENSEGDREPLSLSENQRDQAIRALLGTVLESRESRQFLIELMKCSKNLRQGLSQSRYFCFALIEKRERMILKALLRFEAKTLREHRNQLGRSLLLHACCQRGRQEKIIADLLTFKFDPLSQDHSGQNAISLARAHKNEGLARLMET